MARSNRKYEPKAEPQTKTKPEPKSPSAAPISTLEATPPVESETTHPNLLTITTLHVNSSGDRTQVYIVRPTQIWASLTRYRDCISTTETLLLHDDISLLRPNHPGTWYARILEVRAYSAHHVFLRIFWYYTPSQLPPGIHIDKDARTNGFRKSIGKARKGEVLPSNEMGIVSASDVIGRVEVGRKGDDGALGKENRYDFWGGELFEERCFPGETRREHFEG